MLKSTLCLLFVAGAVNFPHDEATVLGPPTSHRFKVPPRLRSANSDTTTVGTPGSFLCMDFSSDCQKFGPNVCTDYPEWAASNCEKYCNFCDCSDQASNCYEYPLSVCTGQYRPWARQNCQRYCGLCPTLTPLCVDKSKDCHNFNQKTCTEFPEWAREECRKFCSICSPYAETDQCRDQAPDCSDYGRAFCTNSSYTSFRDLNCKRFCGVCGPASKLSSCRDTVPNCNDYIQSMCHTHKAWASNHCSKFCKFCTPGSITPVVGK